MYQHKDQIEKDFPKQLAWQRLEGKRACRIKAETTGNVFDKDQWDAMLSFKNDEMPLVTPAREAFEASHGSLEIRKNFKSWKKFYPTIATQTRGQKPGYGPSGLRD